MSVHYVQFEVGISLLSIEDAAEVEKLRLAIETAVLRLAPIDSMVTVDLSESAGKPSIGELPT